MVTINGNKPIIGPKNYKINGPKNNRKPHKKDVSNQKGVFEDIFNKVNESSNSENTSSIELSFVSSIPESINNPLSLVMLIK